MGGGLLPAAIYKNKLYFLLGREHQYSDTPLKFSDFGGGQDGNETTFQTAIREGTEEMTGFLGTEKEVKKLLKNPLVIHSANEHKYDTFLFPISYDLKLVEYYNNNQKFLQQRLSPNYIRKSKLFEKCEIKWFTLEEMKQKHSQLRSFFKPTFEYLINHEREIYSFIRNKSKRTRKRKIV